MRRFLLVAIGIAVCSSFSASAGVFGGKNTAGPGLEKSGDGGSVFIGNVVIGIDLTEFGSVEGSAAVEFPSGTAQGHFETYWLRYDGGVYYGAWPWPVAGASKVTSITPLAYVEDSVARNAAFGEVAAGALDIAMLAEARHGDTWLTVNYEIQNNSDAAVDNIRFFQFADIDIGEVPFGGAPPENEDDTGKFDATQNAAYLIDHVDDTVDPAPERESDPEMFALGIKSPVPSSQHDVYGGPNPAFPFPFANPAYYHAEDGLMNNLDTFFGDVGITMEWQIGSLQPGESAVIPVLFFGVANESEIAAVGDDDDDAPGDDDDDGGSEVLGKDNPGDDDDDDAATAGKKADRERKKRSRH